MKESKDLRPFQQLPSCSLKRPPEEVQADSVASLTFGQQGQDK